MAVTFFAEGTTPRSRDPTWKILQKILGATLDNSATPGGTMLPQLPGPVSGWPAPSDITLNWARWNEADGIIYVWNTSTQAWEPSA